MAPEAIRKLNVGNFVFERLLKTISSGEWTAGAKIPSENELSKTLGVSRVSVRSALHRLVALDLVETRQGEGTYVKDLTGAQSFNAMLPVFVLDASSLLHMLEFREIFECGCASIAAKKATSEDIEKLEWTLDGMTNIHLSLEERFNFDTKFHTSLGDATKNPITIKMYDILECAFYSSIGETAKTLGFEHAIYYHSRILNAIKSHDSDAAYSAMLEHIRDTAAKVHKLGC